MAMIGLDRTGDIAVVTLDRPPVNAFSQAMWELLTSILEEIAADEGVAVAVLTGTGTRAFSAGADTRELADFSPEQKLARSSVIERGLRTLGGCPVPIVAAINGPAVGGGLNITTLCDLRIASEDAHFSLPEIRHGTVAGGGAFLLRIGVPMGVVRRLIYTGQRLDAAAALSVHLIDEAVPYRELMPRAMEVAGGIAEHGRGPLMRMKRASLAAESEPRWYEGYVAANDAAAAVDGGASGG